MNEPIWLSEARSCLGLAEIPGTQTNATILRWLAELKAWWRDDETPWCGTFVAHCLQRCGFDIPKNWMRARAWADWGRPLMMPVPGCIVVVVREGGGHVGFVLGQDSKGNLLVLGGNQGNKVSIAPFSRDRVVGYSWPETMPIPALLTLPVLAGGGGRLSTNEA